jgi:hypothetical protein
MISKFFMMVSLQVTADFIWRVKTWDRIFYERPLTASDKNPHKSSTVSAVVWGVRPDRQTELHGDFIYITAFFQCLVEKIFNYRKYIQNYVIFFTENADLI